MAYIAPRDRRCGFAGPLVVHKLKLGLWAVGCFLLARCCLPSIELWARVWTISRRRIALSRNSPATEFRSRQSRTTHGRRGSHRWRAAPIVVFVIPAVLCASTVKLARASSYKAQPILCDGVDDDDTAASILCALPEETTKKLSSAKAPPSRAFISGRPRTIPFRSRDCPSVSKRMRRPRQAGGGVMTHSTLASCGRRRHRSDFYFRPGLELGRFFCPFGEK